MEIEVILFILPLITGLVAAFSKLKEEGEPIWKKIKIAGIVVALLTLAYLIIGIYSLADESRKREQYQTTVDSLNVKYDSIKQDFTYLKGTNDAYYVLLQSLGYKLDTTKKEAKRNIDSLITALNAQKSNSSPPLITRFGLCQIGGNMIIEKKSYDTATMHFSFCNSETPIHDITVKGLTIATSPNRLIRPYFVTILSSKDILLPNVMFTTSFTYMNFSQIFNSKTYMYLKGTYRDEKNKIHEFTDFLQTEPTGRKFIWITDENDVEPKAILDLVKQKGLL